MTGPGLDGAAARRWSAGALPGWVPRGLLVAGWVAALAVALFTDDAPCVPEIPAQCGPDRGFAVVLGLGLATPVLLLTVPAVGCLAGILFGIEEVLADPLRSAATAFGLHGAACLGVLGWLVVSRSRQARVARDVAGAGTAVPAQPPPASPGGGRRLLAAGLLTAGVAALLLYRHDQGEVDRHLAAATREPARVTGVDQEGWHVSLLLPATEDRVTLDVIDPGTYEVGTDVPVLVDRTDRPPWVALVAEQPDPTFPLTAAVLAGLLAAVAAGWDAVRRRALRRLATGPSSAVAVLVESNWDEAILRPVGGGPPFARLPLAAPLGTGSGGLGAEGWELDEDAWRARFGLDRPADEDAGDGHEAWDEDEWTAEEIGEFGRAWRSEDPEPDGAGAGVRGTAPATVVGDLRAGGWVALETAEGTWWPSGPVKLPRRSAPWHRLRGDEPPPHPFDVERLGGRLPGHPVPAAPIVPELPLVARPPAGTRLVGAALLAGAAAALLGALLVAEGWYETVVALLLGGRAAWAGADRLLVGVRLERAALVVLGRWRTVRVPWSQVHGARRDGDSLTLAWQPDELIDVGPFQPDPGGSTEDAAERVGGAVMALRERALAAGYPGGEPESRWSPAAASTALYAAAAVAVGWLTLR